MKETERKRVGERDKRERERERETEKERDVLNCYFYF